MYQTFTEWSVAQPGRDGVYFTAITECSDDVNNSFCFYCKFTQKHLGKQAKMAVSLLIQ